jgi:hypothetical protein
MWDEVAFRTDRVVISDGLSCLNQYITKKHQKYHPLGQWPLNGSLAKSGVACVDTLTGT